MIWKHKEQYKVPVFKDYKELERQSKPPKIAGTKGKWKEAHGLHWLCGLVCCRRNSEWLCQGELLREGEPEPWRMGTLRPVQSSPLLLSMTGGPIPHPIAKLSCMFTSTMRNFWEAVEAMGVPKGRPERRHCGLWHEFYLQFPVTVLSLLAFLTLLFREFLFKKINKSFIPETLDGFVTLRVLWKL